MKIAIDASHINRDRAGIGNVISGVIKGLKYYPSQEITVVVRDEGVLAEVGFGNLPLHITETVRSGVSKFFGGGYLWYYGLGRYLKQRGFDILIMPTLSPASLFFPKTLHILYDLSPLSSGNYFSFKDSFLFRLNLNIVLRKGDKLMSISQTTKDEIKKKYPSFKKDIVVIPLGLSDWVLQKVSEEEKLKIRQKYSLKEKFLFSLSTLQPRKNYVRMIEAFAQVAKEDLNIQYVIAGGEGWDFKDIYQKVQQLEIENRVIFLGFIPEEEVPVLLNAASALAYVSLEEGFGFPIIQARAVGLPVICSDIPVFREMKIKENIVFADRYDVKDIANGMRQVLQMTKSKPNAEFFEYYSWKNAVRVLLKNVGE